MEPNDANMCDSCLRNEFDFSAHLVPKSKVIYCPDCLRFKDNGERWLEMELESVELLRLCVSKLAGLEQFRVKGADFIFIPFSSRFLPL